MAGNRRVFLEVSIDGVDKGKIVIELFDKEAPKTANFHALCTGEKGKPLHYKGSLFGRVIPDFMCCGGDDIGCSIYGSKFPVVERSDPNRSFAVGGLLCTAHGVPDADAPYTCGSGFFITNGPTPWLDGMHTIFGRVVGGMDVVKAIEKVGTRSGTTKKEVRISDCGELLI
ncbi:unnamed protein product [Urochloa decumbens]|uniref:Peptidyl-prolyl cis-trans isomerase n=1 Tax=Urochloa decumbens TaxID=240449 RepID=A0ABC9DBU0_9POAL